MDNNELRASLLIEAADLLQNSNEILNEFIQPKDRKDIRNNLETLKGRHDTGNETRNYLKQKNIYDIDTKRSEYKKVTNNNRQIHYARENIRNIIDNDSKDMKNARSEFIKPHRDEDQNRTDVIEYMKNRQSGQSPREAKANSRHIPAGYINPRIIEADEYNHLKLKNIERLNPGKTLTYKQGDKSWSNRADDPKNNLKEAIDLLYDKAALCESVEDTEYYINQALELSELLAESINDANEIRKRQIDQRVKQLERINDSYMATHGEMNTGIYNKIQELMDERDKL